VTFARAVLGISAVAFFAIGVPALLLPESIANAAGLALNGALADNDFRAVYGGLQCGCGLVLLIAAFSNADVRAGLRVQQLLFGGLVAARCLSVVLVGSPGSLGLALLGGELLALASGFLALRRLPAS
jgi:hypothetical protein